MAERNENTAGGDEMFRQELKTPAEGLTVESRVFKTQRHGIKCFAPGFNIPLER